MKKSSNAHLSLMIPFAWTFSCAFSSVLAFAPMHVRAQDPPQTNDLVPTQVLPFSKECAAATALLDPSPSAKTLGPLIDTNQLREPTNLVLAAITQYCSRAPGAQMADPMRLVIAQPFALANISAATVTPILRLTLPPVEGIRNTPQRSAAEFVCKCFGATTEGLAPFQGKIPVADPQGAIFAMDFLLNEPRLKFANAIEDRPSPTECFEFLQMLTTEVSPSSTTAQRFENFAIRARRKMDMSEGGLMRAVASSLAHIDAGFGVAADWKSLENETVPAEIATAVTGPILGAEKVEGLGWVLVGSLADNSYDMGRIAAVFEPGGDDIYTWSTLHTGNQGIIDLAGNDQYKGGDQQGPAGAILGLSLIDDAAGDDQYSGPLLSCGAGMFGVGILIDRSGNDRYHTGAWSMGAGILGAGFLFDQSGSDEYQSSVNSQGIGGPLGIGALVDTQGNDLYRVDGISPGVDGVPTVSFAMSQGIGFGARRLIAGGVGILADFCGDDRYESGEFSQGGGYFYGFGMLLDQSGNDLYRGSHYAQGFSSHQAAGVLIDLAGDDAYWSMISAAQGAAWDTSISLLLDAAGNDSYRGNALSQGSAAEQALAMFCDLDGSDHYVGLGPFIQGESGDNAYHFKDTRARSFSVLIDAGSGEDFFSSKRTRGGVTVTGPALTEGAPASAPLFGLMIDLPLQVSNTSIR
jgi:uncharacterized glyoxalase superfamily protein PhnB